MTEPLLLSKFIFRRKKPKVIVVCGELADSVASAVVYALGKFLKIKNIQGSGPGLSDIQEGQILLFKKDTAADPKELIPWVKNSSQPILVVADTEKPSVVEGLARTLPSSGHLILNFDDETIRAVGDKVNAYKLTFGFNEGAKLRATDCHTTEQGTNFKLNFKGNILPVWLSGATGKQNVYVALAVLSIAQVFNLNLVEVSQALKGW